VLIYYNVASLKQHRYSINAFGMELKYSCHKLEYRICL